MKPRTKLRIILILLIIIAGGFMYGFAGKEEGWGTFQLMGSILVIAALWELLLIPILFRKKKK